MLRSERNHQGVDVRPDRSAQPEAGFVVPYVLVYILILAVTAMIAADRLSNATRLIGDMEAQSRDRILAHSALMETSYVLLAATPRSGGYDMTGQLTSEGRLLSGSAFTDTIDAEGPIDLWVPNGDVRRSQFGLVTLQDPTGLIPLNALNLDQFNALMTFLGTDLTDQERLFPRLQDYIDADDQRRFGGAEGMDYRRADRAVPTNNPLRNLDELGNVIGWDRFLSQLDRSAIIDAASVVPGHNAIKRAFTPPYLSVLLPDQAEQERLRQFDPIASTDADSAFPSNMMRIRVITAGPMPRQFIWDLRRQPNHIEKPFRLHRLDDRPLRADEVSALQARQNELGSVPYVFTTSSLPG